MNTINPTNVDEQLKILIQQGAVDEVRKNCQSLEIHYSDLPKWKFSKFFHQVHLLSYLESNELDNARFLWKRLPVDVKQDEVMKNIWNLCVYMWNRDFSKVYMLLQSKWPVAIQNLIQAIHRRYQVRSLELLFKSYDTIDEQTLCQMLGFQNSSGEIQNVLQRYNFQDAGNGFYKVNRDYYESSEPNLFTKENFRDITNYSLFFELQY